MQGPLKRNNVINLPIAKTSNQVRLFSGTKLPKNSRIYEEISNKHGLLEAIAHNYHNNSQNVDPNNKNTIFPLTVDHLPQIKNVLNVLPPNSKELAGSLMRKFHNTASKAVVAMRRIEYTAKVNEKKQLIRKVIFIQKFWKHSSHVCLKIRAVKIQRIYRGYLFRKKFFNVNPSKALFVKFTERIKRIILKHYFIMVINRIEKRKGLFRISIGIQVGVEEEEVEEDEQEDPVNLNKQETDNQLPDNGLDQTQVTQGVHCFPRPLNILSKKPKKNYNKSDCLKMKISKEAQLHIKKRNYQDLSRDSIRPNSKVKEPKLKLIRTKVLSSSWQLFLKGNYTPSKKKCLVFISFIQKSYRKHNEFMKKGESIRDEINILRSVTFNQALLFKIRLFVIYVKNHLLKNIIKAIFRTIKFYDNSYFLLNTLTGESDLRSRISHGRTSSSIMIIDNELDNNDLMKIKIMAENCNNTSLSTDKMKLCLEEEDTLTHYSFDDDNDELNNCDKKIPNGLIPIIYQRIKENDKNLNHF